MFKPLILAVVLLAQAAVPAPPPMGVVPPMGPMRPVPAPGLNDGITVSGAGYATAQASDAALTLRISSRNGALTLDPQSLSPVVDALVRAGVDRSSIQLPPYMVGNAKTNNATITASVHHPTLAMLQQGMLIMATTFASSPDMLLNSAEVRLSVDNCTALQQAATAKAIANARETAQFIAAQIHARAGDVLAVDNRGVPMGSPGACTTVYAIGPYGPPAPQTADMMTVRIYANVGMRFAIKH